ncbi:DUF726-domain-containing protein [Rhizoclosmatium globosum]|uniref:DUF726-domain-containing protein n=1 Tax=Rhizoclosmatium globosum TaxID=329046 RepID=A0A1Y2BPZ6_9FUNG|nr:DUF726-domain-containing protein [Rhizoclosmatium globosum]|eukprot:ORY36814.1 DUF726-domain-containing protein [Rhizoclosmatium globosum]
MQYHTGTSEVERMQQLFGEGQKVAYCAVVSLIADTLARDRMRSPSFSSAFAGFSGLLGGHLAAFLGLSDDEAAMLRRLGDPRAGLVPGDLVHDLVQSQTRTSLSKEENIRETIVAHLFILSVSGNSGVYDARSRAILFEVARTLGVNHIAVVRVENEVRDMLGLDGARAVVPGSKEGVEKRNKEDSVKRVAYIALATIAGGVLIGATAGLAGPAVAGVFTSAHAVHCGGTAAVGLGSTGVALFATGGAVTAGGMSGFKVMKKTRGISEFEFVSPTPPTPVVETSSCKSKDHDSNHTDVAAPPEYPRQMNVLVTIPGFISTSPASPAEEVLLPFTALTNSPTPYGDPFTLLYESPTLSTLGAAITLFHHTTSTLVQKHGKTTQLVNAMKGPLWTHRLQYLIDKPWNAALEKAGNAGYLLADALESRVQGGRPVTLIGFSLGAVVIYEAILELGRRGRRNGTDAAVVAGRVQSLVDQVVLIGCPVVPQQGEWESIAEVVTGRVVNAYLSADSVLAMVFRNKTKAWWGEVAGMGAVKDVPGIESVCLDGIVEDHGDYYLGLGKVLEKIGFDGVQKGDEREARVFAKAKFDADVQEAKIRFKDEWIRDMDLAVKQEAFDETGGSSVGGVMGWFKGGK